MYDRQLRSLLEVAKYGSFSKAADNLFISKPALKKQIDTLESDIGFPLFIRNSQGLVLTKLGADFIPRAKQILDDWDDLVAWGRAETFKKNVIRISNPPQSQLYLEKVFLKFHENHPEVHQEIMFRSTSAFHDINALLNREVDIVECVYSPDHIHNQLSFSKLFKMNYNCLMIPSHPLASLKSIQPSDFSGYEIGFARKENQQLFNLLNEVPNITLKDIENNMEQSFLAIFNLCYNNSVVIAKGAFSKNIPGLISIPLVTDFAPICGLLHLKKPIPIVEEFISLAKEIYKTSP